MVPKKRKRSSASIRKKKAKTKPIVRKKTRRQKKPKAKTRAKAKPKRVSKAVSKRRSTAAKRGWDTRRQNEARERARKEHARMQRQERAQRRRAKLGKKRRPPRLISKQQAEVIIPPDWKRVVFKFAGDVERMAAQVAERIRQKVIGVHDPDSYEAQIVLALIAAEQSGTFNQELYDQAGLYPDYDTPSEVYTLWLYSGN